MRTESAAKAKGNKSGAVANLAPRDGSELHKMWQLFRAAPAQPICLQRKDLKGYSGNSLRQLRDFYGMDIRPYGKRKHPRHYWLVGEWFGRTYVDYVADRRAQEEREARKGTAP